MPHDSPLSGGYTPGSVEGSMKLKELTDLCTKLVARVTSLETELKKTKEVHGKALTKLVKKVKRLEDELKSTNKRKKAKMVIPDEEELVSEDPSKQGRMEETEYADVKEENAGVEYDFDLTEQQVTPLKAPQVEVQSQETFEAELRVLSAAKILAEASKERVKTYNRRRGSTDSSQVSTTAGLVSTAEDIQDTDEEQTKALEQQEQERANLEAALKLQKQFDQERKEADNIDWNKIVEQVQERQSGSMIRYQALKKKPVIVAQARKNIMEIHTEDSRKYWKIIRVSNITEAYQSFEGTLLKAFDIEDLDTLWSLVKEKFRFVKPTEDMERALWVELKRLYEPDKEDTLWKLQRYMHDPLTWILLGSKNVTTAGTKAVVSVVQGHKENVVKSLACWIWRPTGKIIDYISKDRLKHMTENKSYLTDYQDIDGGFVAFAGSPKGGKITRKGKIRTGKLDFEDVYFIKELKFNLFSVSQMCDKKNSVLFTETEFLILSLDFKLLDESQATIDESNLWHRRLGHVNFKTMNKLVRGNLVRGLPLKLFENDHTCVACQKGKQHKASFVDDAGKKNDDQYPPKDGDKNGHEKDVRDQEEALRKQFDQETKRLVGQGEATITNSTNRLNTASPSISVAGQKSDSSSGRSKLDRSNARGASIISTSEVRNKARLFAQGYTQEEGIDYDEVFAPIARIEAIRLFFAYASFMRFIVYQMDVKSAFLYGTIEEEVYVCHPSGFEDPQFPNKVYKVEKALYGLHQAPRAWYKTLSTYLIEIGFRRGTIDKNLFIKKDKGLQVQQKKDGIFISQDKYVAEILKKFDFATVKTTSTPMEPNKALVKDEEADSVDVQLYRLMIGSLMYLTTSRPDITFVVCACTRDSPFDLEAFYDSDYAGASLDRKSTIRGCQFLGKRLISWQCNKQTIVANSTTKAEYVAAANCYRQVKLCTASTNITAARLRLELKDKKELAIPGQTTTGKEFSNPLMAGSLPKTISAKCRQKRELVRIKIDDGNAFWNEIEVNTGDSKLMLLRINLLLQVLVNAARHNLLLLADTHELGIQFSSTIESAIIRLVKTKKFNFSKYIFDNMMNNLEGGVKFLRYPRFVQVFLDKQVKGMSKHKGIYVTPSHTKKIFANIKREGKGFSRRITPLFQTIMVQALEDMGEDLVAPADSHSTPN
ncbi:putative ribonuclease H-like domain-containing protein [Tanacetum coccineum]